MVVSASAGGEALLRKGMRIDMKKKRNTEKIITGTFIGHAKGYGFCVRMQRTEIRRRIILYRRT